MKSIVFVHGLSNKPEESYLHQLWKRKLAHGDGLDCDTDGIATAMSYWADVLYAAPDTNLAEYEATESEALTDAPSVQQSFSLNCVGADPKLRRLSIALGVDPDNLVVPEVSPDEIAAVHYERIPVPAWLRKRLMVHLVRDAYLYFHNEQFTPREGITFRVRHELRRRFMECLRAIADRGVPVVVAHSMGTIIAYDCLLHEPDCPTIGGLITIGSPLGLDEVQDFFPGWTRQNGFPAEKLKGTWVNIYDPLDPVVGLDPLFANDYRQGGAAVVLDVREDSWGTWRHSVSKYLQGQLLRQHLRKMLEGTAP
jgi:pimeloyl-ACP methyl ester carboxylesterase